MVNYRIKNRRRANQFISQCDMVKELLRAIRNLKADISSLHYDYSQFKRKLSFSNLVTLGEAGRANVRIEIKDFKASLKSRSEQLTKLKKLLKQAQRGVQYTLIETSENNCYPYVKVGNTIYKAGAFTSKRGDFELIRGGTKRHKRKKHPVAKG